MDNPRGVTAIGNQLFVSDTLNHRVLIFTGS
jgi:NHL repeat